MVGCDRLVVSVRVREMAVALQEPDRGSANHFFDARGQRIESNLRWSDDSVIHTHVNLGKSTMRVEFNPSRIARPAGGLCRFDELEATFTEVLGFIDAQLGIGTSPEDRDSAVVQRIDVARDFAVDDGRALVQALFPLKRPRATKHSMYLDPKTAMVSGVVIGNRESHVKLYVRDGHHPDLPTKDWLRFEVQARGDWLQRLRDLKGGKGLPRSPVLFSELTPEGCKRLLTERWIWSAFGTPYSTTEGWWQRTISKYGLETARALAGYLFSLEHGLDLQYAQGTLDDHQRRLRQLGVPVHVAVPAVGPRAFRLLLRTDVPRPARLPRR